MKPELALITKVENDAVWRVFYCDPHLLATGRPIDIVNALEEVEAINNAAVRGEQRSPPPSPKEMVSSIELLPHIKTPWIAEQALSQLALSRLWLDTRDPVNADIEDSCLFAFPRHHLSLHPAGRLNQTLRMLLDPIAYEQQTLSTSKFHILLKELDIQIIDDLSERLRDERYLTSGASFDVSVAIAKANSRFPTFADGESRPQWREGSLIALKRMAPPVAQDRLGSAARFPQVHRSLIHELRILSHMPLRNHRNLINVFGIAWEKLSSANGTEYMAPVVLQSCATRGDLRAYLRANEDDKELTLQKKILFCIDILDGLAALHASNVVHGDVKCDNILLEEGSQKQLVAKLSDFGFSIIIPKAHDSIQDIQVEVLGGTPEYMAPEVYFARQTQSHLLDASIAFSSDIYSVGLAISEIVLDGRYIFSITMRAEESSRSTDSDDALAAAWIKAKVQDNADDSLLPLFKGILEYVKDSAEYALLEVIHKTFRRHAENRAKDIGLIRSELAGKDFRVTISTDTPPMPVNSSTDLSTSFLFEQRYQIFVLNGKLVQILVNDVAVSDLEDAKSGTMQQTVQDLQIKANGPLLNQGQEGPRQALRKLSLNDVEPLSLNDSASVSFCAYQMFVCHIHGFEVPLDYEVAIRYLHISASGGYLPALIALANFDNFNQSFDSIDGLQVQNALECQVSAGPRFGFLLWMIACRTLRNSSYEAYEKAIAKLNNSGYAELGEAPDCYRELDAETYTGPDTGYQWIARGTMPLVLRMLPILTASEFVNSFADGFLPNSVLNYNHETVLYICSRAGDSAMVLALLEAYDWARGQTTMPNKQGRLPIHWLWAFEPGHVEKVASALIAHGADIEATDEDDRRAIDYAIIAHHDDIVQMLIDKNGIFQRPQAADRDLRTLICALCHGEVATAIRLMKLTSNENIRKAFVGFCQTNISTRILEFGSSSRERLRSLIEAARDHIGPSNYIEVFERVLLVSIGEKSSDFVDVLLETGVVPKLGSSHLSMLGLSAAAKWSQLEMFKKVLRITDFMTNGDSHYVLGMVIQHKGQSQLSIASAYIDYLIERDSITKAVNYRSPWSCPPHCTDRHTHLFYPTQFWNAIDEGAFDIATLLAPFEDTEADGVPTTLFHIIKGPKPNTLEQLDFLFSLNRRYSKYLCDPIRGFNALHAVAESSIHWSNKAEFRTVLKTILEWFSDLGEDIDGKDNNGATALHMAAYRPSLDTVDLLTLYGADVKILDNRGFSAYDMALQLARYAAIEQSKRTEPGTSSWEVMRERRPRETDEHRATVQFIEQMCRIFVHLSKPGSEWVPGDAVGAVREPPSVGTAIKGLVPMSSCILFTDCTENHMELPRPVQAWAVLEEGKVGFRLNIRRLDEFTYSQLLVVAKETLDGRDGSMCAEYSLHPYLYRTEIYPIRS